MSVITPNVAQEVKNLMTSGSISIPVLTHTDPNNAVADYVLIREMPGSAEGHPLYTEAFQIQVSVFGSNFYTAHSRADTIYRHFRQKHRFNLPQPLATFPSKRLCKISASSQPTWLELSQSQSKYVFVLPLDVVYHDAATYPVTHS